jgi:hypothetical protein
LEAKEFLINGIKNKYLKQTLALKGSFTLRNIKILGVCSIKKYRSPAFYHHSYLRDYRIVSKKRPNR